MSRIEAVVRRIDRIQQRHTVPAFAFGVVKKFGDDAAGTLAALMAYYGFLSLFPYCSCSPPCSACSSPTTSHCSSASSTPRLDAAAVHRCGRGRAAEHGLRVQTRPDQRVHVEFSAAAESEDTGGEGSATATPTS